MQRDDHQDSDRDSDPVTTAPEPPVSDHNIADRPLSTSGPDADVPLASLIVSGVDTIKFLQGQLTNDLNEIDAHNPFIAAICTPEGKLITIVRLEMINAERIRLITYREHVTALLERLARFKLRIKVDVEVEEQAWSVINNDDNTSPLWPLDAPLVAVGQPSERQALLLPANFTEQRLAHGAIHLPTDAPGELLVAGVPSLVARGVSFSKGCYVGQELVARTDSRGAKPPISLFVARFSVDDASPWEALSTPTQLMTDSDPEAGEIRALLVQGTSVAVSGWVKRRWSETIGLRVASTMLTLPTAPLS